MAAETPLATVNGKTIPASKVGTILETSLWYKGQRYSTVSCNDQRSVDWQIEVLLQAAEKLVSVRARDVKLLKLKWLANKS